MWKCWILRLISAHFALIIFNACHVHGFSSLHQDVTLPNIHRFRLSSTFRSRVNLLSLSRNRITTGIARPLRTRRILTTCALPILVEAVSFNVILSKVLGYCIVAGSFFLQMPQLLKIMKSRSVLGLSSLSRYSEVPISSSTVIYHYLKNLPFSSYGEVKQNF
jgi:uncharacterized membrane protein